MACLRHAIYVASFLGTALTAQAQDVNSKALGGTWKQVAARASESGFKLVKTHRVKDGTYEREYKDQYGESVVVQTKSPRSTNVLRLSVTLFAPGNSHQRDAFLSTALSLCGTATPEWGADGLDETLASALDEVTRTSEPTGAHRGSLRIELVPTPPMFLLVKLSAASHETGSRPSSKCSSEDALKLQGAIAFLEQAFGRTMVLAAPKIDSMIAGETKRYVSRALMGGSRHLIAITTKGKPRVSVIVGGTEVSQPSIYEGVIADLLNASGRRTAVASSILLDAAGSEFRVRADGCYGLFTLVEIR